MEAHVVIRFVVPVICIGLLSSAVSEAQSVAAATPAGAIEFALGNAAFVDDAAIHHSVVGGSVRLQVLPRVAIGPELVYMQGPRDDRDWMLTGNVTFDLRAPQHRPRIVPFLVAGAGLLRHHDRFGGTPFVSSEGAFTAGGGVRATIADRWFVGGEARFGWEPHTRLNAIVGVRFGR